jgi:hypothetical protein
MVDSNCLARRLIHQNMFIRPHSRQWVFPTIAANSVLFIIILFVSALWEPAIRILHFFQALIYVAVIWLCARRSAWGYGAGTLIAGFWNWVNIYITTFISSGLQQLELLFQTGHIKAPDQLIGAIAGLAHFILIGVCLTGYFRLKERNWKTVLQFWGGGVIAIAYLISIILIFGKQFIWILKEFFALSPSSRI